MRSTRDPRSWLVVVLVLAPLLISVALVGRYGVDVPVGDQWSIATMFSRGWQLPPVRELLAQANESRPFFPKLLFVTVAQLGEWDVRREMLLTQILLAGVAAGLVYLWSRTIGLRPLARALPLGLVSLWLFSPTQYDNFFWGIQLIVDVPFLCLVVILVVVAAGTSLPTLLASSAVLSGIAMFWYANGILVWLLSVPAIVWTHWGSHRRHWRMWASWLSMWVACAWIRLPRPGRRIGAELKPGPCRPSRRAPRAVSLRRRGAQREDRPAAVGEDEVRDRPGGRVRRARRPGDWYFRISWAALVGPGSDGAWFCGARSWPTGSCPACSPWPAGSPTVPTTCSPHDTLRSQLPY